MSTVICNQDGLTIDGRPFYLLSAQLHYFRYPKAEWRDLLLKAKAAGINSIDTVIVWNLHEPNPGQFNFEGLADLPAYIDLCAELGLKFIARPGPYICAEWENGGIPAWLGAEPSMSYRWNHPAYMEATLRWFDTLLPLIVARQHDRGGPIILVQIENEHWASGVYGHDPHQATMAEAMRQRGVTMPLYTCVGPMNEPEVVEFRNGWAGIDKKLVQTRHLWPDSPMIVSELWSGWFDDWGSSRHNGKTPAELDQRLHELTASGSSGFSHWMWAGGTQFGYWGGRTVGGDTIHMTTSYDYDAPVSEYGGLTEKYFVARRHHLLLGTLGSKLAALLVEAKPGGPQVISPKAIAGRATGGGAPLCNVENKDFTATYLRNDTASRQTYQLFIGHRPQPKHLAIEVEAHSIKPIFTNVSLNQRGLSLRYHTGRLLGFWEWQAGDTLVMYGFEGEMGQFALTGGSWKIVAADNLTYQQVDNELQVCYWIRDRPTVMRTRLNERPLTVILLTQTRAERCWPVVERGFVIGPHYRYESQQISDSEISLKLDSRGDLPFYWLDDERCQTVLTTTSRLSTLPTPTLDPWDVLRVSAFSDSADWQPLAQPQSLESLGCHLGYGWYRLEAETAAVGQTEPQTTLAAPWLNDRAQLFVDGQSAGTFGISPAGPVLSLPITVTDNQHTFHLLMDNLGRFNYGSKLGEVKGLTDTLYWGGQQHDMTTGWVAMWQEAYFAGETLAQAKPSHLRADGTDVDLANFAFSGSDVWLMREFRVPPQHKALIYLTGDRNPGALFINGQQVTRFSRHFGGGFHKYDITQWLQPDGENVITLYIRDYAGAAWQAHLLTYDPAQAVSGSWAFRAGVQRGEIVSEATSGQPRFYRSHFSYNAEHHGEGPFKLTVYGLKKGQLWLNEHNLGRYWQIGPQEFYKVPVSWLQAENELLIFEEADGEPRTVELRVDSLASPQIAVITV